MKIELDNFIIESDKNIKYADNIVSTLENNVYGILNFFELKKLSKKKIVKIYTDREKYKAHMLQYVSEFKEWMCADTCGGDINLLEISEARKSKEHEDMDIEEFVKCILHEFVHSCQQELHSNPEGTNWYWEALATNLSGQDFSEINLLDCDFKQLQKDFNNTKNGYNYAFTIGRFVLNNYSKEKVLEYIKKPSLLKKKANDIFELAKLNQIKRNRMNI